MFWAAFIVLCVVFRDQITVDSVVSLTPTNTLAAVCIMLGCFALKSVSVFIYGGILYAASGMLFSLPVAFAVNVAGTVIMVSIPYLIGRRLGSGVVLKLTEKYPRLHVLQEVRNRNEMFLAFFTRIVVLLPSDLVGRIYGRYEHKI